MAKKQYAKTRKNKKNLQKVEGGFRNQNGVFVSEQERKRLESLVNMSNRRRRNFIKETDSYELFNEGKSIDTTMRERRLMGMESDFYIAKKSKSLQRFTSRKQFELYMANLEKVNKPNYLDDRIRLYKRNFTKSLEEVYGWKEAKDIIMKVRMMKPADYMKLVMQDETLEISYIDSDQMVSWRLDQIRAALGMKVKNDGWQDERRSDRRYGGY